MFDPAKVAQMAAYFLLKQGGTAPYMKLLKLMYLADRESMRVYGETISGDYAVSMQHGPVLSYTLDLMKGRAWSDAWTAWISRSPQNEYNVVLSKPNAHIEFDELHGFDTDIMDLVHAHFGHLEKWQLVRWTHDHCAEWSNPGNTSQPIRAVDMFRALGFDEAIAQEKAANLAERESLSAAMSRYR